MKDFVDNLPLDGEVIIDWRASKNKAAFSERGIYKGYLVGNTQRCAVQVQGMEHGHTMWINRKILRPSVQS